MLEAPDDASPTHDGIVARARDADALCFFVPDRIDAALLDALPRLRVLAGFGKGYDNVDLAAARARDIVVTNVPFGLTEATADLAWALLLGLARRVAQADAFVRAGTLPGWHPSRLFGARVHGATLGLRIRRDRPRATTQFGPITTRRSRPCCSRSVGNTGKGFDRSRYVI